MVYSRDQDLTITFLLENRKPALRSQEDASYYPYQRPLPSSPNRGRLHPYSLSNTGFSAPLTLASTGPPWRKYVSKHSNIINLAVKDPTQQARTRIWLHIGVL